MQSDKLATSEAIGIPSHPGNADHIELFEKFLDALDKGRDVTFKQTASGLRIEIHDPLDTIDEQERQLHRNLVRRTLAILQAGLGYLVATKGSPIYFEFWVECPVVGGLPPHRWTSLGELYNPTKFKRADAAEFGLATLPSI
jgi:hypothetical protein